MTGATFTLVNGRAALTAPSLLAYVEACPAEYARYPEPDWQGAPSFDAAREMALHGSPKHRAMMLSGLDVARAAAEPYRRPARRWDVAGERECPGRSAAGDPACMLRRVPRKDRVAPVERWLVHMGALAEIDAVVRCARGAALLALLDQVESRGRRVEVELVLAAETVSKTCGNWESRIMAKRAEDPLSLDVMAFCLVCPAIHRWLDFSLRAARVNSLGMGNTREVSQADRMGQIYFPSVTDGGWLNQALAARRILEQHDKGLDHVG